MEEKVLRWLRCGIHAWSRILGRSELHNSCTYFYRCTKTNISSTYEETRNLQQQKMRICVVDVVYMAATHLKGKKAAMLHLPAAAGQGEPLYTYFKLPITNIRPLKSTAIGGQPSQSKSALINGHERCYLTFVKDYIQHSM